MTYLRDCSRTTLVTFEIVNINVQFSFWAVEGGGGWLNNPAKSEVGILDPDFPHVLFAMLIRNCALHKTVSVTMCYRKVNLSQLYSINQVCLLPWAFNISIDTTDT